MKFVAFSDTHGQHNSKYLTKWFLNNPADVLLFAGDLQRNGFDDGVDFVQWISLLPYKHKICTFGNHDSNYDYTLEESRKYDNIKFLINESINIDGINIWGSPYSVQFMDWSFMGNENELFEIYKNIPTNTDMLLTHTPLYGILDETISGVNAGSMSLFNRIADLHNLRYSIFGHIHENFGAKRVDNVSFINASVLDVNYKLKNWPIMFEL